MIDQKLLETDRETDDTISAIIKRMRTELAYGATGGLDLAMDLTVCHNQRTVNLSRLLAAAPADFAHDLCGIGEFLDRETGELTDCFVPRCRRAAD